MISRRLTIYFSCLALLSLVSQAARGQVDESPIDVHVVNAFPNLTWPASLTGEDTGLIQEPRPIAIMGAGDGSHRLFCLMQPGTIEVFPNDPNVTETKTFLDLRGRVHYHVPEENEEGLLGLAFHPKFKENGLFYVYYTNKYASDNDRHSVISQFSVSKDDPNRADPDSEKILLKISQPFWNHDGGTLVFGPDGYLYIGMGDGGHRADPMKAGQNLATLLAKILRIDVDHQDEGLAYAIPKDNPFVGQGDARGEVWATGVRNIWRMAFDRKTGQLWAGDVGQDLWEEIDLIQRGGNYGWSLREAKHEFEGSGVKEPREGLIEPIWEYPHEVGKSITGGGVYRGKGAPELDGYYLYADFVSGKMWALKYDEAKHEVTENRSIQAPAWNVTSFGEDDDGEMYFTSQQGTIWKFESP